MANLSQFASEGHSEHVPAGHYFFKAGTHGKHMYVVTSGQADIVVRGKVLETVQAGGLFGEMALIDHRERSADVIAKSDTNVAVIDEERFRYLVHNDPSFALEVMKVMADRLRRADERL